ncbi:ATP-binding domain-containing protein [Streptomyces tauricus]|uniref:ATP-binding domain-containing protein n=1 Tax=Streptomyces tauricus TaxID=68274 RepID=UPI00387F23C8
MSTTPRDAVIATEQKAVDRAYSCYEARLAEMTSPSAATASASGKDSIAARKVAETTAEEYGGLGGEALVVSRVDIQEMGGTEPETFYVGRRHVFDTETRDQVVVSWTNPIAVRWHNARPQTPEEVILRRRLRCTERRVEDFLDEIALGAEVHTGSPAPELEPEPKPEVTLPSASEEEPVPLEALEAAETLEAPESPETSGDGTDPPAEDDDVLQPRSVPSPRDVGRRRRKKPQPVDEFLLRELRRSRSGRMRDIVETIRRDQLALVTDSPEDILVIQGGPGTGKSAVGLHRVTWLVNNDHFRAQDILVVGPHQNFLEYVGRVLPTLGTRNVTAVQLALLWEGDIRGTDHAAARLVKSDERMSAVLRGRVESECRPEALDSLVSAPSHAQDEPAFVVAVGSTSLRLPRSEVLDLLREAREGTGAYRARRDRFRTALVDRLLGELVRIAPRRSRDRTVRRDLERNRQVTTLVDRTWPSLSPEEALRSLLNSPTRLGECAAGILDDGEQSVLQRPRAESAAEEPWTVDDLVCLEELRSLIAGETPQRYRHIVVDEAQDLTPMQARSLRRRCPTGSMTVLGDLAQATGPHSHTSWDRLGGLLADRGSWRVTELNTSYRVPAEIMEFVAPLAHAVAPSLPYPTAVRRAGAEAVRLVPTTPWELLNEASTRTARLVGTDDGQSPRSIAVIVPDDSDWLEEVRRRVDRVDGMTEERARTVSVLPAAQAKGMEFDHVLVLEPTTIADRGPVGLRQLYVALTRSTQTLTVLHTTPLPRELDAGPGEAPTATGTAIPTAAAGTATAPTEPAGTEAPVVVEPSVVEELPIGTTVKVRVLGPGPGANWKVEALVPKSGRTLLLVSRHGEPTPRAGARLDTWVTRNEGPLSLVAAGDFGRRPITARIAPRYEAALGVLHVIARGDGTMPAEAAALLSELKGMANRCLRRDRVDWLSVWHLLDSADRDRLSALADLAQRTRQAVTSRTPDLHMTLVADPSFAYWNGPLVQARDELHRRFATEPASQPETAPELAPGPETAPEPRTTHEQKEPHSMDAVTLPDDGVSRPPGQTVPSEVLARELTLTAEADRDCNTHEAVRYELKAALLRAGLRPSDSPVADVIAEGPNGLVRYEVLGAGRSAYADLRAGAVRLMEIDHIGDRAADRRYLVLSEPPTEDWAPHMVREVFGVDTVWRTEAGWEGQNARPALHVTD